MLSTSRMHWVGRVGPRTCAGIERQVDISQLSKRCKRRAHDILRHTLLEAACEAETGSAWPVGRGEAGVALSPTYNVRLSLGAFSMPTPAGARRHLAALK